MEISKSLQEEIVAVQNKLQNAILEHQIYVEKSKDDPNNSDILGQIQQIQLYIVSLGRCQKQIVQRLRKEVEAFKADNANGSKKISIPSLLGLNNNSDITNNNETKRETAVENGFETKPSKEDYEEIVRNGDVRHSPAREREENDCAKQMLCLGSVETVSGEDDVAETSMDENSNEKQEETQQEEQDDAESVEQQNFLYILGLLTKSKFIELQNKRVERKRRSTANPQFVYSMLEQPSKRKRHTYLQSGNAPHTRQTTARMNGPSPPPPNKPQPTKSTSTSPPAQAVTKSLIPIQRSITRPNILRNTDSKVFVNKGKADDNQTRSSVPSAKSIHSIGHSGNKTVHIAGLPSSVTIERIESDSVVCVCCRNPGILTVCKNCSNNYHISCHIRSPAPARICPKCVLTMDEEEDVKDEVAEIESQVEEENKLPGCKKDEKFVTAALTSGAIGKTREDTEVNKTTSGFHKVDTSEKKHILSGTFGVNQLSASTFLIPIAPNNTSTSAVDQPESGKLAPVADAEQRQQDVSRNSHDLHHQHSRSSVTYVQARDQMPYSYQLSSSAVQPEKHQSYLIVKAIEPTGKCNQSGDGETDDQNRSTATRSINNLQLFSGQGITWCNDTRKKQTGQGVPVHRVALSKLSNPLVTENFYHLDRAAFNGRKPWAKFTRGKLCINQSARSTAENVLPVYDGAEDNGDEQVQQRPRSAGSAEEAEAAANFDGRGKHGSRAGALMRTIFTSSNKPYTVTSRVRESRGFGPNDRDYPLLRQQLCRAELESREQPDDKPPTVQLQRRALTRFFEHVKLEEAHISAPLGTKLAPQDEVSDDDISRENARNDDGDAVAEAPLLTPYDLDRNHMVVRWTGNFRDDSNSAANKSPVHHPSDVALTHSGDLAGYELDRDNAQVDPRQNDRTINACRALSLRIAQSSPCTRVELSSKVSVPDDKADTERQDSSSGRRSKSRSSSTSSSGHSDTPEQAMNNASDLLNEYELLDFDVLPPRERGEEEGEGEEEEEIEEEEEEEEEDEEEPRESLMVREPDHGDATTG